MGLLGELPDDIRYDIVWLGAIVYVNGQMLMDASSKHAVRKELPVGDPEAVNVHLEAYAGDEKVGHLYIGQEGAQHWEINDLRVEEHVRRRGIAKAMLAQLHSEIGDAMIDHSEDLSDEGLSWAMAMDGGEGMHRWEMYNCERIRERFVDGELAAAHDQDLQRLVREGQIAADPRLQVETPVIDISLEEIICSEQAFTAAMHQPVADTSIQLAREPHSEDKFIIVAGLAAAVRAAMDGEDYLPAQVIPISAHHPYPGRDTQPMSRLALHHASRPDLSRVQPELPLTDVSDIQHEH